MALSHHKTLKPRTRVFTDKKGISKLLLCLYGKIESLPVLIWIPTEYPLIAPNVYIDHEALGDKNIQHNIYIDSTGIINFPSLFGWDYKINNLTELIDNLSKFIREKDLLSFHSPSPILPPRVHTKDFLMDDIATTTHTLTDSVITSGPSKPKRPDFLLLSQHKESDTRFNDNLGLDNNITISPSPLPKKQMNITSSQQQCGHGMQYMINPEQPLVSNINALKPELQTISLIDEVNICSGDMTHHSTIVQLQSLINHLDYNNTLKKEIHMADRQHKLESTITTFESVYENESQILKILHNDLNEYGKAISREIKSIDKRLNQINKFLTEHNDINVNLICSTETVTLDQLYNLVAKDYALSDTIHELAHLLSKDIIPFETFVKKTRSLAREQYLIRVYIDKIRRFICQS